MIAATMSWVGIRVVREAEVESLAIWIPVRMSLDSAEGDGTVEGFLKPH
jgi:hypothetical protein